MMAIDDVERVATRIRRVDRSDRDELLRLRTAFWPDHPIETHVSEIAEYAPDNETLTAFVAVRPEGGLAGFLEASIRPFADGCDTRPVGYIEGWYVDPDARLQGIGRQLVQAAEVWAAQRGCKEMASDCLVDNQASQQAHLRLGYVETERLIHFRRLLVP